MADIEIQCSDCPNTFTFTEGEQKFYQEKQLSNPRRCKECRARKKAEKEARGS